MWGQAERKWDKSNASRVFGSSMSAVEIAVEIANMINALQGEMVSTAVVDYIEMRGMRRRTKSILMIDIWSLSSDDESRKWMIWAFIIQPPLMSFL